MKFNIVILITVILFGMTACIQSNNNSQNSTTYVVENSQIVNSPTPFIETKTIYNMNGNVEGYIKIFDNKIRYFSMKLEYAFDLPESWEDNFIASTNEEKGTIRLSFYGESEEGKGILNDGRYTGLSLFYISKNINPNNTQLGDIKLIGDIDGVKYYCVTNSDCEICALYDELEWYEEGTSKYQNDINQVELMKKDLEIVEEMILSFEDFEMNFGSID